ncbi:MAG: ABC transporter permease [Eggerthellaceae bacterium]|jgi:putative ABC transport system permease protein|nr:ABC transporter permease [Eggerthellaceae bacterium]MDR2716296.1 ABC transporter permease [Coriobacteriaceae bacterium]
MYIIANALENLLRNKGRNILIMVIIFAIIATTVVSLIINNTASAVIEDYRTRFSSQVSITPDIEKVREEAMANASEGRVMMKVPTIAPELLLSFAQSDALQRTEASASLSVGSESLVAIDHSDDVDYSPGGGPGGMVGMSGSSRSGGNTSFSIVGGGDFNLIGGAWADFDAGTRALADDGASTMPANDKECLVSQDLADLNNISVGDTITVQAQMNLDILEGTDMTGYAAGDTFHANGLEYTLSAGMGGELFASRTADIALKVVGIYDDLKEAYDNENLPQMAAFNHRNEILTTLDTLLAARESNENNIALDVAYFLKSPELLEDFESYVRDAGLSDQFLVSTDAASYDMVVKPVLGLKNITLTFMVVVLVLGAIILILLTSIAIRERKYEIGVLRAMGMKKGTVSLGLWAELLVMTAVCLVLGIGIGVLAAQPITDVLLAQQAEAVTTSAATMGPGGPGGGPVMIGAPIGGSSIMTGGLASTQPLSEMSVTIGLGTIAEIIAIALLLATLAGLVATSRITKYEPIKILMERN